MQLREAVKYSFFLDSYNASDAENYTTDTGNVSTALVNSVYTCRMGLIIVSVIFPVSERNRLTDINVYVYYN